MKKIFVVEDDESICEELVQILENEGYEAESLESFDNTKDDILKAAPNLVLMDIMMPMMDGYAATRAIRALNDPAIANVPIIAMTANAFDEDMHSAMKSGMNGYLSKPLDVDKLYAMMRKCLK